VARASRLRSHQGHPRATNPKIGIAFPRAGKSEIRNPKSEISDAMGDGKSEIRNPKSEIIKV